MTIFSTRRLTGLMAVTLACLPVAAHAGDSEKARVQILQAQGKIEAADRIGVQGDAAIARDQADVVLETARRQLRKGKEDTARFSARHADALAGLAIARARLAQVDASVTRR